MPAELRVENRSLEDGRKTVAFAGEVDVTTATAFREELAQAVAQGCDTVELTGLSYLDSAGVDALFDVARRRPLQIVAGPACVVRGIVELVGLDRVATLRDAP